MHTQGQPATLDSQSGRQSWAALVLLAVAQFMVVLDVTVVNVALPTIGESLRFSPESLQWVVTAYVLFTGGLMLLGGRLADLAGRRRVFFAGLGMFTAASLASGLSSSPSELIVARGLQGVGAALLLPAALSIVTTVYSGRQRAVALSVWGTLGSAGAAAGVVLGGVITTALSWEWIFFVNAPVGIGVAVLVPRHVPALPGRLDARKLDLAGALTLMAGLFALVYAVEGTSSHGWGSTRTVGLGAVAAVLIAAFAWAERRAAAPLVPPLTWRVRSLVSGAGVMLVATGLLVGAFFLNTLYLQHVLGASALETGLAFLPLTLVIFAAAHLASQLLPHAGTRVLTVAGLVLAAAGALLLSQASPEGSYVADLLPGFVALGFGVGLAFVSVSVGAMADVGHESAGLASGLMTTAHELGAAIGVAVLASIAAAGGALASGSLAAAIAGYEAAFVVAAAAAAVTAAAAAATAPAFRPEPGAAVSVH